MFLDYTQKEMAKEEYYSYAEQKARRGNVSERTQNKIARYAIPDEDIKDLLFEVSLHGLCLMADDTLMNHYPQETANDYEMDRTISIIAQGIARKYLTDKQKWCLASFILHFGGFKNEG